MQTFNHISLRIPLWPRGKVLLLAAALAALATGIQAQEAAPDAEAARIQSVAEEAYIYGLPIVMNYAVMHSYAVDKASPQFKAPFNQLHHEARVLTPKDTVIVTPNSDTPYSMSWLDLRAEPVVISVPAVDPKRYYSVQLVDGNTFNYGIFGSLSTGHAPGNYLAVGPDWQGEVPPGISKVFRSTTQFSLTIFRTQLIGPSDIEAVKQVQAGYRVQTLSAFLKKPAPPAAPTVNFPKIDKDLAKTNFFAYLDFALQFAPAGPEEKDIRNKLASIGIGAGNFDQFKAVAGKYRQQLGLGVKAGDDKLTKAIADSGERRSGWQFQTLSFGDRAHFAGNWLQRAALAKAGIFGLDATEALYPMTRTLPNGEPLDGSKHTYTLTFAAGQLPPARAFWSLTMYDGATQFLIENPINRYLINSPMLEGMAKNPDGSITLYLQKDAPAADKVANWLPAPNGPIYLVLRLYGPDKSALNGEWKNPPLVQVAQ
ncbi:DUF1254 domain-containing protein [Rhodoferax sp.]|uniref:DUF1254 domain-containing protein n=1 Tax=Rhodoferax sp. TaxID=50421 RepID=UPI0025E0188D|nr:DUF1254 domain-containing protein [Rhodoferax sp.]